jgi:hypothetical protein
MGHFSNFTGPFRRKFIQYISPFTRATIQLFHTWRRRRTNSAGRQENRGNQRNNDQSVSLFGWLVFDGWCWFVLREEYCYLVAGGWFVVREKYCWLVVDKPSEHGEFLWNLSDFR